MIETLYESDLLPDPSESRTVKPRKASKPCTLPIVAVTDTHALSETTGTLLTLDSYIASLPNMARTIVVTFAPETLLYNLHEYHESNPLWTWRVTSTNEHGRPLLRKRVAYFGFKSPDKRKNRYHVVINASTFFRRHDKPLDDLLQLGQEIREFCNRWNLEVRPSAAGIASQLLKHPMFYPFARRRVPGWLNEEVRPHLPGGYFESYADAGQRAESVTYIDQESAHHYAAMTTPLPNSNSVRVHGYGKDEATRKWARKGGYLYERAMQNHGLVRAYAYVPALARRRWDSSDGTTTTGAGDYVPRLMRTPGKKIVHLWTNEIPYLESLGLEIEYLSAIWGTNEVDNGLAKYAQWASNVTRQNPELKAMLLMPYGLLARHPGEMTYYHPRGDDVMVLANQAIEAHGKTVYTQAETANALQLGLIQAFVRSLSLDMARQLAADDHEIISIYADGVFVKLTNGKQLPIFAPWRIKEEYLELEIKESTRVPVRAKLKRDYVSTSQ